MSELGSAPVPPLREVDHVRGPEHGVLVIEYADFECPFCAVLSSRLDQLPLRRVFRHFPVRSSHPRSWAAACAVEAAGRQGSFWAMHDALFADQARLEDPHLWDRAGTLKLDLERFEADRRDPEVRARVKEDFSSGVRAGVVTTPTLFARGAMLSGSLTPTVLQALVSCATP